MTTDISSFPLLNEINQAASLFLQSVSTADLHQSVESLISICVAEHLRQHGDAEYLSHLSYGLELFALVRERQAKGVA